MPDDRERRSRGTRADGVVGIVDGIADGELDVLRGGFVDDLLRIAEASGRPIQLRDNQGVTVTARRARFAESGRGRFVPVRP